MQIKSNQATKFPKQAFVAYFFEQIKKRMRSDIERLEDLSYNENNDRQAYWPSFCSSIWNATLLEMWGIFSLTALF
ncbi:hypothetical protein [Helicobacter felis]|uniref:hypothetical protein n=1 Tax=Helicobacter felis TaxID=214 RepID=UPI000CEDF90F|nr:hypothetical protein [Helicobacter felis]